MPLVPLSRDKRRLPIADAWVNPDAPFIPSEAEMRRLLAVLSFCLVAASCREGHTVVSNPIVPSPPILETPPKPPLYPPESWTLSASITSVTPHPCWPDLTGLTYTDMALIVHRAEAMRLYVYWDPTDGIEYVGSLSGQDFSLAGGVNGRRSFSIGCASGGSVEVILTGRVSGRFSDDGRSISAEEVLSYLYVRTGEQVDVRFRWAATAPAG
jgi:hypothetical protein